MHALLGMAALLLLMLSALASLGTHLTTKESRVRLLRVRRSLGLVASGAALFHAIASLAHLHALSLTGVWNRLLALGYLRHGALALLVLAALTLTSFPKVNARLGLRTWTSLHRLSYVALILGALHALAGPAMDPRLGVAALGFALAIVIIRVLVKMRKLVTKTKEEAEP